MNNADRMLLGKKQFVDKARAVHDSLYDYSQAQYIGCKVKVTIICPTHGAFLQTPNGHLLGQGCSKCGRQRINEATRRRVAKNLPDLQQSFIYESNEVHGFKYDYSKVQYKNAFTPVAIVCLSHGEFLQTPNNHSSGRGCKTCGADSWVGGYNLELFEHTPALRDKASTLYLVEVLHGTNQFLKVGITIQGVTDRLYRLHTAGLQYKIIYTTTATLYQAYVTEQEIKTLCKTDRYYPTIKFAGYTECFKLCARDKIVDLAEHFLRGLL